MRGRGEFTPRQLAMTDSNHPWRDESLLYKLYWDEELSTNEIADKLECAQMTIWKWMRRFGIPRRDVLEVAPNRRRHPAVFTDRGYVIYASNYRETTNFVGIHLKWSRRMPLPQGATEGNE